MTKIRSTAVRAVHATALLAVFMLSLVEVAPAQRRVPGEQPDFPRIQYADSLVSLNDRCIVKLVKLNPKAGPVYVNGSPIGFCWTPCVKVFGKDPGLFLKARGIELASHFDVERPAVLDSTMCARVNYEFFFFADASEKRRFEADPLRYCGIVTDPVSRVRFRPSTDSPRFDYERQRFYFSSDSTRARFAEMPEMFAAVQAKMKKEASQESVREKEEEPSQEP